jgi:hypothetical protein
MTSPLCLLRAHRGGRTRAWRTGLATSISLGVLLGLVGQTGVNPPRAEAAVAAQSSTVWLCRPGLTNNPCTKNLATTVVRANGTSTVQQSTPAKNPPIDCFYVYPTVSKQPTINANLHIDPEERAVATEQASRFSQVCRVYAPMYPQLTLADLSRGAITPQATSVAYRGVLSAWNDYLAHYNNGRGVVLIGHSQGAALLIGMIRRELDPHPAERHLLVSAILLGGNVAVPAGKVVGGDFAHVPACQSDTQTGCVVAYSTFSSQPSAYSSFGRVDTSINGNDGLEPKSVKGLQVLCTNPAALAGGPGPLVPYFPSEGTVSTPWVSYPNLYRAQCLTSGGATWLQVTDIAGARDNRPVVQQTAGPGWGLHDDDVNLALGNLVQIVQSESAAYAGSSS